MRDNSNKLMVSKGCRAIAVTVCALVVALMLTTTLKGSPSTLYTSIQEGSAPSQSWAKCQCRPHFGCFILLGGCRVKAINSVAVITPIDSNRREAIGNVIKSCETNIRTRLATDAEHQSIIAECALLPHSAIELAVASKRDYEYHPYHNTIFPTGAFQHFSVQRAAVLSLKEMKVPIPVRLVYKPLWRSPPHIRYLSPVSLTKLFVYAMTLGTAPPDLQDVNDTASCSAYHAVGLWRPRGILLRSLEWGTPKSVKAEFKMFRDEVLRMSIEEFGDVPFDSSSPVLYCPRTHISCEQRRVRFMTKKHVRDFSGIFLNETGGSSMAVDHLIGTLDSYSKHFHAIRARKILFGSEGAFFTWLLIGKPESVWVMYYRAPLSGYNLGPPFFTKIVEALPDVKLVLYYVTNGIAPPLEELVAAVREPFRPFTPKFVGASPSGFPHFNRNVDPIYKNCTDEEVLSPPKSGRLAQLNNILHPNIL